MIVKYKQFFKQIEKKERRRGSLTVKFSNFGQGRNYTSCLTHRTANCNTVDIFNKKNYLYGCICINLCTTKIKLYRALIKSHKISQMHKTFSTF